MSSKESTNFEGVLIEEFREGSFEEWPIEEEFEEMIFGEMIEDFTPIIIVGTFFSDRKKARKFAKERTGMIVLGRDKTGYLVINEAMLRENVNSSIKERLVINETPPKQ